MISRQDLPLLIAWAAQHALALFPIPAWCKKPTGIVDSHATGWSRDPEQWRRWYDATGGCNFGVECGPSRLIVVDIDIGGDHEFASWVNANHVTPTWSVRTPTGGWHCYFSVPQGIDADALRQPNLCGPKVNVRAGRGYVVAPYSETRVAVDSSVKADGQYLLHSKSIFSAPQILLEHCSPNRQEAAPAIARDETIDLDASSGWPREYRLYALAHAKAMGALARLEAAVPGERNEQLNKAAFALGKLVAEGCMAEWRAVEMLQASGEKIGIPRDEAKARSTIRSGLKSAPKVGMLEPKSAMDQLLACAVPIAPVKPLPPRQPARDRDSLVPVEPLVERLLYPGEVTYLSGESGSGKTTFIASLMAASVGDVKDFTFGQFGAATSDLMMQPCCWIFVSYEGGQHIRRTNKAWFIGAEVVERYPERCRHIEIDDGMLVSTDARRNVVVNEAHARLMTDAIDAMRRQHVDVPIVLVLDNATAAVENCMDPVCAGRFSQVVRTIARQDIAVVVLAHPPKAGHSDIYGSHLFYSLGDTVATIEVLRNDEGEWIQWVEFSKHRQAPNGQCLEVRSRRIDQPIVDLPEGWGRGNVRARERMLRELRVPFVSAIRIREKRERDAIKAGTTSVPTSVSMKTATEPKV